MYKKLFIIILLFFILTPFNTLLADGEDQAGGIDTRIVDPMGGDGNINVIIGNTIQKALGVVGSLALVMFVISGFMWMSAGGNSERVTKAKNIMIWTTMGLVVIFSSYAIIFFIIKSVSETT